MNQLKIAAQAIRHLKNWPTYFIEEMETKFNGRTNFIKKDTILYRMRNGTSIRIHSKSYDRHVIKEVYFHHCYSPPGFEIQQNDVIVDIGAHVGIFTLFASAKAKHGRVLAIEPVIENFSLLTQNIEFNNADNVTTINKAAFDSEGIQTIYFSSDSTAGHSFRTRENRTEARRIETISLRGVLQKYELDKVDLLKIDCEGAEYATLFGSSRETLRCFKKICIECHPIDKERNIHKLGEFLEKAGFRVDISVEEGMLYAQL